MEYLHLLPKDIKNLVQDYQNYNNKNNKFFLLVLELINWHSKNYTEQTYSQKHKHYESYPLGYVRPKFNNYYNEFFNKYKIGVKFETVIEKVALLDIKIEEIPLITNEILAEFLILLIKYEMFDITALNYMLYKEGLLFSISRFTDKEIKKKIITVVYGGERFNFQY